MMHTPDVFACARKILRQRRLGEVWAYLLAVCTVAPGCAGPGGTAPERSAATVVASSSTRPLETSGTEDQEARCIGLGPGDRCMAAPHSSSTQRARNVMGDALSPCGTDPMTGWFRDGYCRTDARDLGVHVVCAEMTEAFLMFTAARGNDLSTPRPQRGFAGLRPGDRWCLCAARWAEAERSGSAPPVVVEASHARALDLVALEDLRAHASPTRRE